MTKRTAALTIRVTNQTMAVVDMLVGELRAKTGRKITQDEAIWELFKESRPHLTERVEELQQSGRLEKGKQN